LQKTTVKQGARSKKAPCELMVSGRHTRDLEMISCPGCLHSLLQTLGLSLHGENSSRGAGTKTSEGILGARAWAGPNKKHSLKRALAPRKSTEEKSSLDERRKPEMGRAARVILCGQLKNRAARSRLKPGGQTLGGSCAHEREEKPVARAP
jgi:hypothetical protein